MTTRDLTFLSALAIFPACVTEANEPVLDTDDPSANTSEDDGSSTGEDPDDGSTTDAPLPPACPEPTEGPTMHPGTNVESAETWTAAGSPHLVPYDFTIHAPVLIEPCARVQLGANVTLTIGEGGALVGDGTEAQPVIIERLDDAPWTTIRVLGGEAQLFYTTLIGGGAVGNGAPTLTGALWLRAPSGATELTEVLRAHHVEIRGSEAAGLRIEGVATIAADSTDLVITDGESHPISASATVVGAIPPGTYTGNADDRIVLTTANNETVYVDTTIHDRGVPYLVGQPGQVGELRVQAHSGDARALLTIEPGVELQFQPGGVLTVEHATGDAAATGALVAVGTADDPIVMTSASDSPAAGDWLGVYFGGTLDLETRMDFVEVAYAGGSSSSGSDSCPYPGETIANAAIRVFGVPPAGFVTNTNIVASANHGIDRGWRDDAVVDLLPTNTFDVIGCEQTWSKLSDGSCPDPVPCP